MALGHGAKIVTNGLVFAYDMGPNPGVNKSWKGAPTTNLYADGDYSTETLHPVRSGPWSFPAGITDPNGNQVLRIDQDGTTSYHGRDIAVTVGETYTSSAWIYASPDSNTTALRLAGEQGFAPDAAYDLSKKGTWQRVSITGTATTTNARILAYQQSNMTTGYCLFGSIQFEQGSFATPFVNGTRSNTEALLDWAGNNTITIDKLEYTSSSEFNFDGSTGRFINLGTQLTNTGNTVSIECWFKSTASDTSDFSLLMGWGNGSSYYSNIGIGNWFSNYGDESIHIGLNSASVVASYRGGHSLYHDNSWHHAVFVMGPANYKIYVDGESKPLSYSHGNSSVNVGDIFSFGQANVISEIGNRPYGGGAGGFTGQIPITRVYSRELTAAEAAQNFNALRGRYGI